MIGEEYINDKELQPIKMYNKKNLEVDLKKICNIFNIQNMKNMQ